uniref:Uncharacterized protein n=1 Tax=Tanacetum cinerariifolium TaxID=118510 RepID=A0A699GUF8_TANCI|nr:hypothetical protein [Tanacetum cinerariifolium]
MSISGLRKKKLVGMVMYITGKLLRMVESALSCKPAVSSLDDNKIDFGISFDESDDEDWTGNRSPKMNTMYQRHPYLRFEGLEYTDADIAYFEERLGKIYERGVHRVKVFNFGGLNDLMAEGLHGRMLVEHRDAQGQSVRGISSKGDFLGSAPSYIAIKDPMLRLCHRLIVCSVAGRSHAPKKVIATNLFYLMSMDVDSVNILYLLTRYLRRIDSGRKHKELISRDTPRPERQPDDAAGAPEITEGATNVDEDGQAVLAPVQAPQPPAAA